MSRRKTFKNRIYYVTFAIMLLLVGCGKSSQGVKVESQAETQRSNETVVLNTESPKNQTVGEDKFLIDISMSSEGYINVDYSGDNNEVRLQILEPDNTTYTFVVNKGSQVYPLSGGSGTYTFTAYEAMKPEEYATVFSETVDIVVDDLLKPYLYPNVYVDFSANSEAVSLAKSLAEPCTCDLEVIGAVYDYVTANITYDHDKAATVSTGYLPVIDETLSSKTGICFDYAALMAAMLRSQRIPTRLEIGYAGTAYHAWVSSYIEDIGWINGVIEFNGNNWTLMDPTFAANSSSSEMKNFIGDGDNYVTKYVY